MNYLSNFTRKLLCWSLVFIKVACWKMSQNSQVNNCARDVFLIKLQAEGTTSSPNCWYTSGFIIMQLIQNLSFLHHFHSVFLVISGDIVNCLHSANIISNVESCRDDLQKKTNVKSNETGIFAESCQSKWISFLDVTGSFLC